MLLAVFALVIHGALPAMAMPAAIVVPAMHAAHPDCPGHVAPSTHASSGHHHSDLAASTPTDTEPMPAPGRQMDCCTAVAAAVLPAVEDIEGPEVVSGRFALETPNFLEGVPPAAPSEPPRPSDQG